MSSESNRTNVDRSSTRDAAVRPLTPSIAAAPTDSFAIGRTRSPRTRRTVDLSPGQHRALDIWQREAADRLGRARVTGQEVLTALIDQLLSDPRLSTEITRALQARR
jgi:hypothetical protein